MTNTDQLRRQLGLGANEGLELAYELQLENSDVGLGFAATRSLWEELVDLPHWQELSLGAPVGLFAWEEQSGVYRLWLGAAGELRVLSGAWRQVDERVWHIDARQEEVTVRASLDSGDDLVLLLGRTECQFFRIASLVEVPALDSLTGDLHSETWLRAEYQLLAASPSVVDRVAAVGLTLRLWQPTSAETRRQLVRDTLVAESPLLQRVRQWAAGLSPALCGRCALATMEDAEALEDVLAAIDTVVEQGDEAVRRLATHIALERDRLESIVAVLAVRGDIPYEQGALDRLDEQASLLLSQLSSAGVEHPLLERAGEVEPFAWWGAVASP
jgi:hypothetical protein